MQIDQSILKMLCCPITKRELRYLDSSSGQSCERWLNVSRRYALGEVVGVLETSDGGLAYPVWKDVLGLLPEFAKAYDVDHQSAEPGEPRVEKKTVAKFYDEFGWVEQPDGNFNDALAFEDLREVTAFYRKRCHRRVNKFLREGEYLLDVASGPVQIPEYRTFSNGFKKRICIDLSVAGLLKAKERLGDHAICIAGDITALPLREAVVDCAVSLHTIYHVPSDEQSRAVSEVYRVIKPGGTAVIVYSWGARSLMQRIAVWMERHTLRLPSEDKNAVSVLPAGTDLYFSPQNYSWYLNEVAGRYPCRLRIWRSVGKESLQHFIRGKVSAVLLLWPLLVLEGLFPQTFGRIGVCPMFVLDKPQ